MLVELSVMEQRYHAVTLTPATAPALTKGSGLSCSANSLRGIAKSCGRRVLIDHAATLISASSGRSMSTPFSNLAPARTSATRCGPLT
jgi:hypothetical protein